MYDFGKQFHFNYTLASSNPANVIKGTNYRFTILSETLIRLEYSDSGSFEDRPTELVWYRNMNPVNFQKKESDKVLEIETSGFSLTYIKERPFEGTKMNPVVNLKVSLKNSDRVWYYGHSEVRNIGAIGMSLDANEGKIKLKKGLYSSEGFVSIDDSKSRIMDQNGAVIERMNNQIDTYLFMYGNDYLKCLRDYYMVTGSPNLVPRYALGNWWSKNDTYNQIVLNELIDQFNDKEIPLSVVLLNHNWNYHTKDNNGFTWNTGYFKNPVNYINSLHQKNIHLGLSINPTKGFNSYESMINVVRRYLNVDNNGIVPFNVYDPKWIDVYFKIIINPIDTTGVDFYFIDVDDKKYNELLWLINHYHINNYALNYNKRPFILSRNGNYASHRYPVTYMGKLDVAWDSLKKIAYLNITSTNNGNNFITYDIGGYKNGVEDSELYTRFVQLGVFSPILNLGSDAGYFYKRAPWRWDYKTYKIVKDFLNLRHRLIPYIYSESYKYYKFSMPLIIPFYYKYPSYYDDENYRYQYYFGNSLFVSPIMNKKEVVMNRVVHKFILPEGTWYHYDTGKKYVGKKPYMAFYKDEDYPVFVKVGTIIPMLQKERKIINDTSIPNKLEISIYPGASSKYDFYEDDGITSMYKYGSYFLSNITYQYAKDNHRVILAAVEGQSSIVPKTRSYQIKFKNTREADKVKAYFNGQEIPFKTYTKNISFIVEVENIPTIGTLVIDISGNGIDIEAESLAKYDIISILQDLPIDTLVKEEIFKIIFDEETDTNKKKVQIKRLDKKIDKKFVNLLLKLLEYLGQV